jgi:hypothetical protein
MGKSRSPNYPAISLGEALERVRRVYDREHRGKMPTDAVAVHLGYRGLNGAALTAISALRKYGLLEGPGLELRVSQDAVTILVDRPESTERQEALRRCALRPVLFTEIAKEFEGGIPSEDNLRIYLQKRGFIATAASSASRAYRETMALVTDDGGDSRDKDDGTRIATADVQAADRAGTYTADKGTPRPGVQQLHGEIEVLRHEISPGRTIRVLINGPIQLRDFDRLIQLLNLQKDWHKSDTPSPGEGRRGPDADAAKL